MGPQCHVMLHRHCRHDMRGGAGMSCGGGGTWVCNVASLWHRGGAGMLRPSCGGGGGDGGGGASGGGSMRVA